ncbi:RsmE family RNA methyltransferase [Pelagicoccus mobilis]|uniref:Ribosomal RNA small subunit methyltransferase E n=1 Tax=Pelagicoccus mobilis TaxID=415221 RepID=A0A934S6K5_9BACT|nr:RsmE family RNA methyltransferase [Pelagicoccus mobilis]MBK1880662.1 16S rRNA (uracil(1498)-N(3))-methyltransferase [Pelagicoccus mobilis]
MNIVLFEESEVGGILPVGDERAVHVLKVLRRQVGDYFDVGLINGPKGKATLVGVTDEGLELSFVWGDEEPPLLPIDLVVGLSRPQTMRKLLNEATTMGVRSIRFVETKRGEPSYGESKLWSTGEWRRHVVAGVAQAFTTRMPEVSWGMSLEAALDDLEEVRFRVALDNYEASVKLGMAVGGRKELALAVGSERGWTGKERDLLRDRAWVLAGMGERVLRTETATVAAVAVAREMMGGG